MIGSTATAKSTLIGFSGRVTVEVKEAGKYIYPESLDLDSLSPALKDLIVDQPAVELAGMGVRLDDVEVRQDDVDASIVDFDAHLANTSNPHGVTKTQVGLSNVDNTSDADKPISDEAQLSFDNYFALFVAHSGLTTGVHGVTGSVVGTGNAQTLSSKRITPRVTGVTTGTTLTPSGDLGDQYGVTGLATNATIAAPTGTPTSGQMLVLSIKDDGVSRTLTWNAIYVTFSRSLPATTGDVGGNFYAFFRYNGTLAKWVLVHLAASNGVGYSWGQIGGTLTDQADLTSALGGKANTSHTHNASDVNAGTLGIARIPTGTNSATVATGDRGLLTGGTTGQVLAKTSGTDYAVAWSGGYTAPTPVVANDSTSVLTSAGTSDIFTSGITLPSGGKWKVRADAWMRAEGGSGTTGMFTLALLIDGTSSASPNLLVEQGVDAQNVHFFSRILTGAGVSVPVIFRLTWVSGNIQRYSGRLMIEAVPV